jgi:hypothetical protein
VSGNSIARLFLTIVSALRRIRTRSDRRAHPGELAGSAGTREYYDKKFADEFAAVAHSGKPDFSLIYWQPGTGPTPDKLKAAGWRFLDMEVTGNAAYEVGIWVHSSGKTGRRDVSAQQQPPKSPPGEPPADICEDVKTRLAETTARLDAAMGALDDLTVQLEGLPPGSDRSNLERAVNRAQMKVRSLIDEVSSLEDEAEDIDERCGESVSDEWMSAMEEHTKLKQHSDNRPPDERPPVGNGSESSYQPGWARLRFPRLG